MKKDLIISFLLFFLLSNADAQVVQEVQIDFKKDTYSFQEKYGKTGITQHFVEITATKLVPGPLTRNYIVDITANNITTSNSDYTLLTPTIRISDADFGTGLTANYKIYLNITNDTDEKVDEVMKLNVSSIDPLVTVVKNETAITILNGKELSAYLSKSLFNPFRITLGTNFDFQEKVAGTFYGDITAFKPDLFNLSVKKIRDNRIQNGKPTNQWKVGFYASVYNNKYSSVDSIDDHRDYYSVLSTLPGDSATILRNKYRVTRTTATKNIAVEGAFTFGWHKKYGELKAVTLTWLLPEVSARRRSYTVTNGYESLFQDTLMVPYSDTLNLLEKRDFFNSIEQETSIGTGFILRYSNIKKGEFMAKCTFGKSYINSSFIDGYYWSCRLQYVSPFVGVNLGTEIRGFSGQARSRYIGLYLSKSFTLAKLTKF